MLFGFSRGAYTVRKVAGLLVCFFLLYSYLGLERTRNSINSACFVQMKWRYSFRSSSCKCGDLAIPSACTLLSVFSLAGNQFDSKLEANLKAQAEALIKKCESAPKPLITCLGVFDTVGEVNIGKMSCTLSRL